MNKNATPIILLILALGIYFTFTKGKIEEYKVIQKTNDGYAEAQANFETLIKVRDDVKTSFNSISPENQAKLDKMVPDSINNIQLILDIRKLGEDEGLVLKNVKTDAPNINVTATSAPASKNNKVTAAAPTQNSMSSSQDTYNTVVVSFSVSTSYDKFLALLKDLETSLRILDISKITLTTNPSGIYDYSVEVKTYWTKK